MSDRYRTQNHVVVEEHVHAFLDGELPVERHGEVFSHLADCAACRETFNSVLRFRQMSRQEHLPVPPSVDEGFFRRLEQHKIQNDRRDRAADRRPLWQRRRLISVRTALLTGGLLIGLGLLVPSAPNHAVQNFMVRGETERVEFRDVIYVIYPGVTVEATKL